MTEIPFGGGNVSGGVLRLGDTVRRPAGPWIPAMHALLGHLHATGFHVAPRPLGLDEHGREVLTFIPGIVAWPDNFHPLDPGDRVHRVAWLIRDFHDAVTGFRPPPNARWQAPTPPREPASSPTTASPRGTWSSARANGRSSTGTLSPLGASGVPAAAGVSSQMVIAPAAAKRAIPACRLGVG